MASNTSESGWQAILPAFAATPQGSHLTFATSYGASGRQLQAVLTGEPADVVQLAAEPEITELVHAGLVSPDWNSGPAAGIPCRSISPGWCARTRHCAFVIGMIYCDPA